jgi:hypothetical protein
VRFANPAAFNLFAGSTAELLGSPAIDEPVELILTGREGPRYVEMRETEIGWEGRSASLAALRDITELCRRSEKLLERNAELMRFNRATVGRELRMIELKQEANALCRQTGEPPRYRIPREDIALPISRRA